MFTGTAVTVTCPRCHRPMGELDQEEFDHWLNAGPTELLCFDCDPTKGALVPRLFVGREPGDCFQLGDLAFDYDGTELKLSSRARAHAHAPDMHACLSSSTYLNGDFPNMVARTDGTMGYPCRVCGETGKIAAGRLVIPCEFCAGEGFVILGIVLPLWLINGGCENV